MLSNSLFKNSLSLKIETKQSLLITNCDFKKRQKGKYANYIHESSVLLRPDTSIIKMEFSATHDIFMPSADFKNKIHSRCLSFERTCFE